MFCKSLNPLSRNTGLRDQQRSRQAHRSSLGWLQQLEPRALLAPVLPSGPEQELLERINQFRADPPGEFARLVSSTNPVTSPIPDVAHSLTYFGVDLNLLKAELAGGGPSPPLSWNSALASAASGHNSAMIAANTQSHQLPGEHDPGQRDIDAGYSNPHYTGENVYAFAHSASYAHAGLVVDWGTDTTQPDDTPVDGMQLGRGHRMNLLGWQWQRGTKTWTYAGYRDIGLSVTHHDRTTDNGVGPEVVTEDLGLSWTPSNPYLLGVAYVDANNNKVYDAGEGLGGVTVIASALGGPTYRTTTWPSGGYQIELTPGMYSVEMQGVYPNGSGGWVQNTDGVQITSDNSKIDVRIPAQYKGAGTGQPDFITGVGPGGGPHVKAFSGADDQVNGSFFAYDPRFTGGVSVAAGDMDGDGVPDIITGAGTGGGPHVQVFSGVDNHVIRSFMAYNPRFTGGVSVAAGDVDGDGGLDIITGAGAGGGPHVQVFDGADGHVIRSFMAYDPRFTGGVHVASGDVDGDGLPDIITGAGAGGGPHVQVFSGVDNHVIRSFMAYDPRFTGGVFVATSRSNRRLAGSPPASSGDQGVGTAPSSPGTPLGGKTVALLSTGLTPVASDSGISVLVPDTSALTLNPARRLRRTGDRLTEYYDLALGVLTA